MPEPLLSRRVFVASGVVASVGVLLGAVPFRPTPGCDHGTGRSDHGPHPTPRPGIDASHVLKPEQLKGSQKAITGNVSTPMKAVKRSSTATSDCLKYFSTRYLSKCVEMAHKTGPENAKKSQDIGEFPVKVCQQTVQTANGDLAFAR